jgi:K+-sensing histidine kinase KdpD
VFAVVDVGALRRDYPPGCEPAAWTVTALFAAGAVAPGIAFEDRELIFEKFGRSSTGGITKPGTGLGLFFARSIVEAHGGWVELESSPGTGSVFTLELPLRARSEP